RVLVLGRCPVPLVAVDTVGAGVVGHGLRLVDGRRPGGRGRGRREHVVACVVVVLTVARTVVVQVMAGSMTRAVVAAVVRVAVAAVTGRLRLVVLQRRFLILRIVAVVLAPALQWRVDRPAGPEAATERQ